MIRRGWCRLVWWVDENLNHDDVTFEPHWKALCDYNDHLVRNG